MPRSSIPGKFVLLGFLALQAFTRLQWQGDQHFTRIAGLLDARFAQIEIANDGPHRLDIGRTFGANLGLDTAAEINAEINPDIGKFEQRAQYQKERKRDRPGPDLDEGNIGRSGQKFDQCE